MRGAPRVRLRPFFAIVQGSGGGGAAQEEEANASSAFASNSSPVPSFLPSLTGRPKLRLI